MELKQLTYFLQICEDKNFTLAAKQLFITQQGLSMSMARLEEELGCKLFDRTARKLQLTKDGEYFLEHAREIVCLTNNLSDHFSLLYHRRQMMDIAAGAETLGLFPLRLQKILQNRDPDFPIALHYAPGIRSEAYLDQNICTFGFVCGPIDTKKYHAHLLMQRDYTYLVNRAHPLAEHEALYLEDFRDNQIILPGSESKIYHEFTALCADNGFKANVAFESDRQIMTYNIVKRDPACIGQVLDYYTENLNDPAIRVMKLAGHNLRWRLYLIWRRDHILTKQERLFSQLVLENFPGSNRI